MINTNIKSVPDIRFGGFSEAWEQRKFSDLATMHARIGWQNLRTSEFLDSGDYLLVTGTDFIDGSINYDTCHYVEKTRYDQDKNIQIKDGSILITKDGTLGKVAFVKDLPCPATLNAGVFNVEVKNSEKISNKYLYQYLKAPFLMNYVDQKSTGGTIKHLNQNILVDFPVMLPTKGEQEKIGELFIGLDNLLTLHQRKYEELKTTKAALLQKMFPQDGEKVPQIRFAGFTDAWKQCKFGEMAEYKKGPFGSTLKKDFFVPDSINSIKVYEQQNAINKNWKLERYYITRDYAKTLSGFEIHGGDIIVSCAGTIGEIYELPQDARPGIINQALMRVRVDENKVSKKMYKLLFLNMIDGFSREHSNGSAMKNIPPFADLKPMTALIPSLKEQEQIGTLFFSLDNLLTLHQCKCDELKSMKAALLQKMFA